MNLNDLKNIFDLFAKTVAPNVGVGTTAPSHSLQVVGTLRVGASLEDTAANANSSTAYAIPDMSTNVRRITLTDNTTITLPDVTSVPSNSTYNLAVRVMQDATGSRTLAWDGNGKTVRWETGSAPSPSPN